MASSIQEAVGLAAVAWTPKRHALDPLAFDCGRVGPYNLGPEIRAGAFGPVHLAIGRDFDDVLEIERIEVASYDDSCDGAGLAPRILDRLNHCVGLRHPHVACLLGAGLHGEHPYLLRAHTLGRTLACLPSDLERPPPDVAAGILYSVVEGVGHLLEAGPGPGVCGPGGVRPGSVFLGWDGSVRIHGAGFSLLRVEGEGVELEALRELATTLDPELRKVIADAETVREASLRLRRWRREACAHRQSWVGAWLRRVDADACSAYRSFFSLAPLN